LPPALRFRKIGCPCPAAMPLPGPVREPGERPHPMAGRQRTLPVRREYNRWVANQTLEDYALRFTAKSARQWSAPRVAQTAIGAISFLALEAIGGAIT